jgi:hypothetical protein
MALFHHDEVQQLSGAVSASSGVVLNGIKVDLDVTPSPGAVVCRLTCNGRAVRITFNAAGDVDTDVT